MSMAETKKEDKPGKLPPLKKEKPKDYLENLPPLKGMSENNVKVDETDVFSSKTEKKHLMEADTLINSQNKTSMSPTQEKQDDDFEIDEEIDQDEYLEDSQDVEITSKSPTTDKVIEHSGTLTASMGIDQSVDSLVLEEFDYLEPVEKPAKKK